MKAFAGVVKRWRLLVTVILSVSWYSIAYDTSFMLRSWRFPSLEATSFPSFFSPMRLAFCQACSWIFVVTVRFGYFMTPFNTLRGVYCVQRCRAIRYTAIPDDVPRDSPHFLSSNLTCCFFCCCCFLYNHLSPLSHLQSWRRLRRERSSLRIGVSLRRALAQPPRPGTRKSCLTGVQCENTDKLRENSVCLKVQLKKKPICTALLLWICLSLSNDVPNHLLNSVLHFTCINYARSSV